MKYKLYNYYDDEAINPIEIEFESWLKEGDIFNACMIINKKGKREIKIVDDNYKDYYLTYEIVEINNFKKENYGIAITKTIRERISNTSTQIVHKCLARKDIMSKMDKGDVIKLEKKIGKKKVKGLKKGRVGLKSYNKFEVKCPDCGVVFWKENNEIPDTVKINKVMNKKRLRKI